MISGKKAVEDFENRRFFNEIEAISKGLYGDKNSPNGKKKLNTRSASISGFPESRARSKDDSLDGEPKDKKSFWNWKPLKALSHTRNKRFNCCFSLIVHSIEGLPDDFRNMSVRVHWKRRDGEMATQCAKVVDGVAEFDERLTHTCSVYGSRSGQHHSAKYEAKHFLLYATLVGSPGLDLGKHRVDLTRLLPLTLEELEEEKSSGKWTTEFKLSGRGKGATMHVSFGYLVLKDKVTLIPPVNNKIAPGTFNRQTSGSVMRYGSKFSHESGGPSMRRIGSLPSNPDRWPVGSSSSVEDIKVMHEVLTNPSSVIRGMVKQNSSNEADKENSETFVDKPEFDVFTVNLQHLDHSSPVSDIDKGTVVSGSQKSDIDVPQHRTEVLDEELDVNVNIIEHVKVAEVSITDVRMEGPSEKKILGTCSGENVSITEDVLIVARDGTNMEKDCDPNEVSLPAQGKELSVGDQDDIGNGFESHDVVVTDKLDRQVALDDGVEDGSTCSTTDILKELQSALETVSSLEMAGLSSPEDECQTDDIFPNAYWKGKTISFEDEEDSVASEFLNLLGTEDGPFGMSSESEQESPRERLLRQFEKDVMADGFPLFDYSCFEEDAPISEDGFSAEADVDHDDFELSSMILAAEEEYLAVIEAEATKTKAKMLEDLETEELMREWGLNESTFVPSPSPSPLGFGGLGCLLDDPSELPSLGEGLGPLIQTKDGGFIRSMRPSVFENSKSSGGLIMQVSNLVVVPAEMGSDVMVILKGLASVGIEKLSMQANKLMPLEDITGKTPEQIAWEASPNIEATESQFLHQHEKPGTEQTYLPKHYGSFNRRLSNQDVLSEYVSLEDLTPFAMDKIEALSMEGLRTQAGMSSLDTPCNISAESIGDQSGSLGMEGTVGLQLVDVRDGSEDVDGLMSLSLTLDEWMRLDSGKFDDDGDNEISERTSKILAAHHANSIDQIRSGCKSEKKRGKGSGKKCGLLGNNFTVALLVQLRDPTRNFEPVGTPMLALVQVERVFMPPKPRIFKTVSQVGNSEEDEPENVSIKRTSEEEGDAQFKIKEVHVAGLKADSAKKTVWGSKTHQQSGSRWLVANGMGKPNKHPLLKSKPSAPTPAAGSGSLWSISSLFWGGGSKNKECSDISSHKRNPDIVFENVR